MSFNTITHPTTGVRYSIFSSQGRNLLKSYLRTYKSGGEDVYTDVNFVKLITDPAKFIGRNVGKTVGKVKDLATALRHGVSIKTVKFNNAVEKCYTGEDGEKKDNIVINNFGISITFWFIC